MLRKFAWCALFGSAVGLFSSAVGRAQEATGQTATAPAAEDPVTVAVQDYLRKYADAFNNQDSAALAAMWAEDGVHIDRETGQRTEGRANIKADFDAAFADRKDARMSIELIRARKISDSIVVLEGKAGLMVPEADPEQTVFTAIATKRGDSWLLASVDESAVPAPESGADALDELDWLVGEWVEVQDDTTVDSIVTWTGSGNYLLWAFVVTQGDEEVRRGTHVIGWDPRLRKIRSWCFESDGSFSESTWANNGDRWISETVQTLADGGVSTGNFILQRVDEDTISLQLVGQELDGVPLPSRPAVSMVRVAWEEEVELEAAAPADAASIPVTPTVPAASR
jgi:uncharacterized protein (TIGR02246 family)